MKFRDYKTFSYPTSDSHPEPPFKCWNCGSFKMYFFWGTPYNHEKEYKCRACRKFTTIVVYNTLEKVIKHTIAELREWRIDGYSQTLICKLYHTINHFDDRLSGLNYNCYICPLSWLHPNPRDREGSGRTYGCHDWEYYNNPYRRGTKEWQNNLITKLKKLLKVIKEEGIQA